VDQFKIITGVDNLYLDAKIGVSDYERLQSRKIRISFKLYQKYCLACNQDNTKTYICYATISDLIKVYCEKKEFKLIEYLCYQLYLLIKSQVGENKVYIKVEKLSVDYQDMLFDASAEYSDL
jgi:dihydroneopterin aldolase